MTLLELSVLYADSAAALRGRIRELREAIQAQEDPELAQRLRRRITELEPLLRDTRELAKLTANYYDRSFYRHDKYTF